MYEDDFEKRKWPRRVLKLCVWLSLFAAAGWWYDHREKPVTARQRLAIVRDTRQPATARRIAADQLEHDDAAIVPQLMSELRSGDVLGRELAALALGRLRTKAAGAVEALVEATNDDAAAVRLQATIALGRIDAQPQLVLAALRKSSRDVESSIRAAAFAALGSPHLDGGNVLVSLLADDDPDVRRRAAIELGQMWFDTDEVRGELRTTLSDTDARVRAEAYATLFKISAIDADELARGMMDDADPLVRRTALQLLAKCPDKTAEMFIRAIDAGKPDIHFAALGQLVLMGETDVAVPRLVALLDSQDREAVQRAAMMLAGVGPPARYAAEKLLAHVEDPDDRVHEAIWIALNNIGHESRLRPPELFDALHADGDTVVAFVHMARSPKPPGQRGSPPQDDPRDYVLTDVDMEHVKKLRHLEYLYLTGNPVGDAGLSRLTALNELKWLDLRDTKVTSAGLHHLVGLSNLRELDLSGCDISDEGLKHLANLQSLRELSLHGTRVTDAGMAHLASLTNLESLGLHRTQVTDDGLARLKGLTALKEIGLPNHVTLSSVGQLRGLTKIDGVPASVTDADFEALQRLPDLRELDLRRTSITDAGLVHLKPLSNLRTVSLGDTKVTQRGAEELKAALPDLVVYGFSFASSTIPSREYEVVGLKSPVK